MRTTKIIVKNLFGIREANLDGKSIEISGAKGIGKTSVLDAIRYALTNKSSRDFIIRQGSDEGEILIETDSGVSIDRKTRTTKADAIKVKDGNMLQTRPAEFLSGLFTPLQLNPIEFTQMDRQEKNRVILSLIEFKWDTNWIMEKFGEIPQGVDYSKHILEVLADIQSEKGVYFQSRQNINRDIRNKQAFIEDLGRKIPENYQFKKWQEYNLAEKYTELEAKRLHNSRVEKAKAFTSAYENKLRGIEAERDIKISSAEKVIADEKNQLMSTIERLKAEIKSAEEKLVGISGKLEDKNKVIMAEFNEAKAKLDSDTGISREWENKETHDIALLSEEVTTAEQMRLFLNEYKNMTDMKGEVEKMQFVSDDYTAKIETARELPSEILKTATIPIAGLTVENGIPLIKGLPISNLSDGELLELCIDITVSKPGSLQIILIDGAERLDTKSRELLYAKCKEKGLQLIATRVTDSEEMEVVEL